jgi:hypothetical protein
MGAYYTTPQTGGFGTSGCPDFIACYKGCFIGIECKAGTNAATLLQKKNLMDIQSCHGLALIIREGDVDDLENKIISYYRFWFLNRLANALNKETHE